MLFDMVADQRGGMGEEKLGVKNKEAKKEKEKGPKIFSSERHFKQFWVRASEPEIGFLVLEAALIFL